jgi:purine-binding chemotaxis protein CheW
MATDSGRGTGRNDLGSLQAMLAAIDVEVAPYLSRDMEELKQRAAGNIRRKKPYVSFFLGEMELAITIDAIQEIGYLPDVTPLPNLPDWIEGIVQIRGEILSVVNFHLLFSLAGQEQLRGPRFYLLYRAGEFKFCLPIDRISGVVALDEQRDRLAPHPGQEGAESDQLFHYIRGLMIDGDRSVAVIDSDRLGNADLLRRWRQGDLT